MPLRPFPIPFKVGTDICYVPRIRKFITQPSHGEPQRPVRRLLRKLLTEHERQYFWQRFGRRAPFDSIERVSQFLAGRGEAEDPKPLVDINELNGQLCELSISHDGDYATAVAIVACAEG
ncbi:hypothetical protein P3342_007963 [Pyrenophora teres f. teres]|nr:hypothetical protein P3342_007963 [Pyrenophora teres f. teres]